MGHISHWLATAGHWMATNARKRARPFGNLLPFLALIGLAIWLYLYWRFSLPHPPVGTFIAVLAFVAALITMWPPETRSAKAVLVAVFGAVLVLEIRTLYHDRDESETKASTAKINEDDRFAKILAANQKAFDATMKQFGDVKTKTQSIADLATKNLDNVTGSNSYAWLTPQVSDVSVDSAVPLAIHNYGPHTLTGVTISVFDHAAFDEPFDVLNVIRSEYLGPTIEVGTVVAGQTRTVPYVIPPIKLNSSGTHLYEMIITSQSGEVRELIMFRENHEHPGSLAFKISTIVGQLALPDGKFTKPERLETTGWSDEGFKGTEHPNKTRHSSR